MSSTRFATTYPVFGCPQELSRRNLPTYEEVMKHYLFVRQKLKTTDKTPPLSSVFDVVSSKIIDLWKTASIPAISKNRIIAMLRKCHEKQRNILKSQK